MSSRPRETIETTERGQEMAMSPGVTADERAFAVKLLEAEAACVKALAVNLGAEFHAAVDLIVKCADAGGTVLVSGLGKSGKIGEKIAATLSSLGIASHFVHPAEAAHGDLGRFRAADICIALSYSGETDEVVNLAAILRQDQVPVISITRGTTGAGTRASLERVAAVALAIGACDDPELSPAPTCSTTATLALGDALALCAARRRNFTDADFAKRHPGGSLGGLMRPVVEALRFVVGSTLKTVPDDVSVAEACRLSETAERRPGAILLVDPRGVLTGLFTDGDLRRLVERDRTALDRPIRDVMTRNPGTLSDASLVRDAVAMVREHRRDEIPVVDAEGRPVGLLDVQDLIAQKLIREG
ncbi:MAG: KpsF/GutQ family sugar-phosphate isomerase [Phycisphaerales bacterium]|nr:KpsF/GutQ family sugar-phosphate isomerase [Phycisphaerales bacterium]